MAAQTPPSARTIATYQGLHKAAHAGDLESLNTQIKNSSPLEARDANGRTALHIAAFASHETIVTELARAGANMNALEKDDYDIVTIAAVANDLEMLKTALTLGCRSDNITSPYQGTALIAAAHLGHARVVSTLINAGAPLDHVNNLQWTALIEAVVLGDGGANHTEVVKLLLQAGADQTIADGEGVTPLQHARSRGYTEMVKLFKASESNR